MLIFCLVVVSVYVLISAIALLINRSNVKKGLKGIPNIQCINPLKWFSVIYGFVLKFLVPLHILEQYVLRVYDEDCTVCIKDGKCIGGTACGSKCGCGCDTLAKMYSPLEKDSGGNWDKIIWDSKKYLEHRKKFPIKIKIEYVS